MVNRKLIIGLVGLLFLLLQVSTATVAQTYGPFTITASNTDIPNRKLYVEMMYEKPSCEDYEAHFRMVSTVLGIDTVVAVDSFLNNVGTFEIQTTGPNKYKAITRPKAGGYRLRFNLPAGVKVSDSIHICVESKKLAYRCEGCGPGGSSPIFAPKDIHTGCPYTNAYNDLLACHRRSSREGNWEAWIRDPRDCRPYRIVLMPDGKWWFAQNVSYRKDLMPAADATTGSTGANIGVYWCHGVQNAATPWGEGYCNTYGAEYTWYTVMSKNGRGAQDAAMGYGVRSTSQGICPDGWLVPSDYDWGVMLNAAEGCSSPEVGGGVAPCNHWPGGTTSTSTNTPNATWLGSNAGKNLRSLTMCPVPQTSPIVNGVVCADITNPSWTYFADDAKIPYSSKIGVDKYGFSLMPSGYRERNGGTNAYFAAHGLNTYFWSSTQTSGTTMAGRQFVYNQNGAYREINWEKNYGWHVRCISAQDKVQPVIIAANCPYPSSNGDLVSCTQRTDGARNWEIVIRDPRDQKAYRAVEIKDATGSMWYMAEYLNYTQGLTLGTQYRAGAVGLDYRFPDYLREDGVDKGYAPLFTADVDGTTRGVCMPGWHLQSLSEANRFMMQVYGCASNLSTADQATRSCTYGPNNAPERHGYFGLNYNNVAGQWENVNVTSFQWQTGNLQGVNTGGQNYIIPSRNITNNTWSAHSGDKYNDWADYGAAYVACVKDNPIAVQTTLYPTGDDATPVVGTQATAVATVTGSGYTYSWDGGAYSSSATNTKTISSTEGVQTAWTLSVKDQNGTVVAQDTRIATACPYTGVDRVAGVCYKSPYDNAWRTRIRDSRDSKEYGAARFNGKADWWTTDMLKYGSCTTTGGNSGGLLSGNCIVCGGVANIWHYTHAAGRAGAAPTNANPSGVKGICPQGWHLPGETEALNKLSGVSGTVFGALEVQPCSYANDMATSCVGNTNLHFINSNGGLYYYAAGIGGALTNSTPNTASLAIRCVKDSE